MNIIIVSFAVMLAIVIVISIVYCCVYKGHDKNVSLMAEIPFNSDCDIDNAITGFEIEKKDADFDAEL